MCTLSNYNYYGLKSAVYLFMYECYLEHKNEIQQSSGEVMFEQTNHIFCLLKNYINFYYVVLLIVTTIQLLVKQCKNLFDIVIIRIL